MGRRTVPQAEQQDLRERPRYTYREVARAADVPPSFDAASVRLSWAGADGTFGTADDQVARDQPDVPLRPAPLERQGTAEGVAGEVKQLARDTATATEEPLPWDRFADLERFIVETLDAEERFRLKLLNPLGVAEDVGNRPGGDDLAVGRALVL